MLDINMPVAWTLYSHMGNLACVDISYWDLDNTRIDGQVYLHNTENGLYKIYKVVLKEGEINSLPTQEVRTQLEWDVSRKLTAKRATLYEVIK